MSENRGLFTLDAAQAYLSAEPEMTTEKLSDRLFTVTDGQVRTIFLEADNSVIAFDTFGTPGRARAYDDDARSVWDWVSHRTTSLPVPAAGVKRARDGQGPSLIEATTYRWKGHVGPEADFEKGCRPEEELIDWIKKCPVKRTRETLLDENIMTTKVL